MITPKAFGHVIKHFDEIDKVVSSRMLRKRPWSETALTSLLCDMMDEETQADEKTSYTFENLRQDLENEDSLFGIDLSIDTFEFNPIYERYLSQSDIGLRLIYNNKIEPELSWTRPFLLQAKKLFPQTANPLAYSEASKFSSFNKNQKARIDLLNTIFGDVYLKYLLFCPRPDGVDCETKIKLAYLRNKRLTSEIFDFTSGLEIHKGFLKGTETLKSGIFITETDNANPNFGQVHADMLHSTFPLSWFIALNFLDNDRFLQTSSLLRENDEPNNALERHHLVDGILTGKKEKIEELIQKIHRASNDTFPESIQILPKHTITLKISVGEQLDPDNRNIRLQ